MTTFKEYSEKNTFKNTSNIKIRRAESVLINEDSRNTILNSKIIVQQKPKGLKVNIIKENNTGRAEEDWKVKFNNKFIYPNEFDYVTASQVRKYSKSTSQLKLIWEHLKKIGRTDIPVGTDLFVEFISNSENTTYTTLHSIVLIKGVIKNTLNEGSLISENNLKKYADLMCFDIPEILFEGYLNSNTAFVSGIKSEELKKLYRKSNIRRTGSKQTIKDSVDLFLAVESKYGGRENGIVVKYNNSIMKYINSIVESNKISNTDPKIIEEAVGLMKKIKTDNIEEAVTKLSEILKESKHDFQHTETLQYNTKNLIVKKFNSGVLFVGKFKDLCESKLKVLREASAKYKTMTIGIVSQRDTKGTKKERNEKIQEMFPNAEIVNTSTTDLDYIIKKCSNEITTVNEIEEDIEYKNFGALYGVKIISENRKSLTGLENKIKKAFS